MKVHFRMAGPQQLVAKKKSTLDMDMEYSTGSMVLITKENGNGTKQMVLVPFGMLKETSTPVNSKTTWQTVKDNTLTLMAANTLATSKMMFKKETDKKSGWMEPSISACIRMGRNMAMESTNGPTAAFTRATGSTTKSMGGENTLGTIKENTKDTGRTTTCMGKESTPGQITGDTKVSTRTTKSMEKVFTHTQTAAATKANGKTANNMVKAYSELPMVLRKEEDGKKANVLRG